VINEVIEIARRRIALDIAEQSRTLETRIGQIKAEANAHGMLGSSRTVLLVDAACAENVKKRAEVVFQQLSRCVTAASIQPNENFSAKLKSAAHSFFPPDIEGLANRATELAITLGLQNMAMGGYGKQVDAARDAALSYLDSEIDLFALSLMKKHEQQSTVVFNINQSTVGAVQSGHGALANVSQHLNNDEHKQLISALEQLKAAILEVDSLPVHDKREVIEVLDEGVVELQKEKPNLIKVRGFMATLGATVSEATSVLANLKPAYETVKAATSTIGIAPP